MRSAAEALQGKTAGVMVTATSGSPGTPPAIRIRGIGTVNNNDPLYVVDGLPQGDIGWLNPNDIESLEILKDASASAIYGARAANGVVMITTIKGKTGDNYKKSISFDAYYGIQNLIKTEKMMNASQFIDFKNLAYTNAGSAPYFTNEEKEDLLQFLETNTGSRDGTNWMKEITNRNAPVQSYTLGISGGSDNLAYHTSLAYMQQDGTIHGSDYDRISWRTTTDSKLAKWFRLSSNLGLIYETRRNVYETDTWNNGTIFNAMAADPITPVYRKGLTDIPDFIESSLFMDKIDETNPFSFYSPILFSNKKNSVAQIDIMDESIWKGISLKGGVAADIDIKPWLKFRSSVGLDLGRGLSSGFTPEYYLNGNQFESDATVSRTTGISNYFVFENTLTFDKTLGDHHVLTMAGISSETSDYEAIGTSKQGLVSNNESQRILDAASKNAGASGYLSEGSMSSYFGRFFYSFKEKYMLTVNLRGDGSSKFAKGNKWAFFPSLSLGWNFSKESFLQDITWLSSGKLRFSWGQIGNDAIDPGAYLTTYSGNRGYYLFGSNYLTQLTGGFNYVGNPDLKWETTEQTDLGLDLKLFENSLDVTVDYWIKKTDDMLLQVPLPSYLGFPDDPYMNAGSVENKGLEFDLKYKFSLGDVNFTFGGNLFTFNNKVTSLGGGEPIYSGTYISYNTTKTEEGKPIGYFFGLKTNGIFQSQNEVDTYVNDEGEAIQTARPGDLRYVDINGTDADGNVIAGPDGAITDADRTMIGNPFPDFTYGFNFSSSYKGFDIYVLFQGSQGNDIMNVKNIDFRSAVGWYNAPADLMEEAWTPENHSNTQFAITTENTNNLKISDWLVEDGSYMRLKNMQLGYSLPQTTVEKMKMQKLRIWLGASNLFTITNYSGLDPEIGSSDPTTAGIDFGYYPQARTYTFGISATF